MGASLLSLVRAHCVTSPALLLALLAGNLAIAAAYLWIPRSLDTILRALPAGAPGRREVRWFAVFIRACAGTHLAGVAVLFFPGLDWPAAAWLAWAAGISLATAVFLSRSTPAILAALSSYLDLRTEVRRLRPDA